ncbi:hypothetical protein SVA_0844 [Sulfurifustis variabilis]|uniref:Uncharacterized protein n=1 Tax=Sulfurifustis variabilis TaxID=1675686 RepID=A0A1B4V1V5_9GAMM|nr:hypothetical protein [Sulfurifustis variabilis]BAU47423.1 hypothetical protein SVA_0844 [Sulfurifustis variabilis]
MSYGYVTTEQLRKAEVNYTDELPPLWVHGVKQTTGRDPRGYVVWVFQRNDPLGGPLAVTPEGVVLLQEAWSKGLVR